MSKHFYNPPIGGVACGAEPRRVRDKFDEMADEVRARRRPSSRKRGVLLAACAKRGLWLQDRDSGHYDVFWRRDVKMSTEIVAHGTADECLVIVDAMPTVLA
jgi:hypothetical protein